MSLDFCQFSTVVTVVTVLQFSTVVTVVTVLQFSTVVTHADQKKKRKKKKGTKISLSVQPLL